MQWIIDCFPETKAASFLQSIVDKSESSDSFDVSIKLSCQDRIEGYAQWSKQAQQHWDYENDLADELKLSIAGDVEANVDLFFFKVGAEASLRLDSGIKVMAKPSVINNNLIIKPQLHFNGLTVHWAYHAHMGHSPKENKGNKSLDRQSSSDNEKVEGKKIHHSTLIDSKTWPEEVKPFYLSRGVL